MTTPRIRVDTTVNTNVKGSKVFALAFLKVEGTTDSFTEEDIRAFVVPKLGNVEYTGSAIVQLDSVASGNKYHSGRGDESFTGLLTKVFADGVTSGTTTVNSADFADVGINVYFMTMDGINETAIKSAIYTTARKWWRIEYQTTPFGENYRSRILELGLRDELTASLPSSGSSISPILRTNNLKDIYVWARFPKSSNAFTLETDTFLHEQTNILNISNIGYASGLEYAVDVLPSIFDGSTSTSQQGFYAYDVINSTDSTGHIRFDYEFTSPTHALEIIFTDGNDLGGSQGAITNMSIYSSVTGSKNDAEWDLHSTFTNVAIDSTYQPKGLKVIQYNQDTKQWDYKGIFVVP